VGELAETLGAYLKTHLAGLDTDARVNALTDYARGLGMELPNKSMMSLARELAPENVEGCRQRMQRAIAFGRFDASAVFGRIQTTVGAVAGDEIKALCVDDTGIAKQGPHSVGVQRQYSGTLGRIGNCQVVTTLHAVSNTHSFCLGGRLYLPKSWASEDRLRTEAQLPDDVGFVSKPQAALTLIREAISHGVAKRIVLGDAAFGDHRTFRDGVRALGMDFAVGVSSNVLMWPIDFDESLKAKITPRKRVPVQHGTFEGEQPISVGEIARALTATRAFRNVTWRQGTKGPMKARFARVRVCGAERYRQGVPPSEPMWLLVEKTRQKTRPFKYFLSSLSETTPIRVLVDRVKMRWRIEMDYRDMKQHLGFDQYEGRIWGGFHRHLAMVTLMQVFIALHRERFSPRSETPVDLERILPSTATCCPAMA